MPWVRRSAYLFLRSADGVGEGEHAEPGLTALSVLTGEEVELSRKELDTLLSVPVRRWIWAEEESILSLAANGLLVTDEDDKRQVELRRRDSLLAGEQWHPVSALFHFSTRRRGALLKLPDDEGDAFDEIGQAADDVAARFVEEHGHPPAPFHSLLGVDRVPLELVDRKGGLYDALHRRETTRGFDRRSALSSEELSIVLYEVFGCHGFTAISDDVSVLKRTSPSGGGLHPVEVYPLVRRVEGLEPGLYHYAAQDHALELIEKVDPDEGRNLISEFTCGQVYFGSASVAFLLTARFFRSFWKYRRHSRAYASLLMDAAHLSQSLYLVCAELGLGAFVTTFVNGADIEGRLGLDGYAEGALVVCGCGRRTRERSRLDPLFAPYVPRETSI